MPRTGPQGAPPLPGATSTFAQWVAWLDYRKLGLGEQFISWIQANSTTGQQVDLNSTTYGPPPHNTAASWVGVWLADAEIGPELGKVIAGGITATANKIPGALQGAAQGIGQVPGAKALSGLDAIGSFFSELGQANTWIRVAEVLLGLALIIVGLSKLTGAGQIARQAAKVAAKTGLAAA